MLFISLIALSALFVAGCAAFFSIKGLIVLFSGSALSIGIMASSLELGKLVAASFLHTYWNRLNFLLKTYLCLAVIVLMSITSLGIFGFLTGAYQTHAAAIGIFETKIAALQSEKESVDKTIESNVERIKNLVEIRAGQEQRVQLAANSKAPREQAYKAIEEANSEIKIKEEAINKDRERVIDLDKSVAELQITMNTTTDVGSFKFIAKALDTDIQTAVEYFIFALIAVFDPLAVALVLCWNKLVEEEAKKKKIEDEEYINNLRSLNTEPASEVSSEPIPEPIPEPAVAAEPEQEQIIAAPVAAEKVEFVEEVKPSPIKVPREKPQAKVASTQVDTLSRLPIAEVADKDLESHPRFMKMSPEQKRLELLRRAKTAGRNNSVITRG